MSERNKQLDEACQDKNLDVLKPQSSQECQAVKGDLEPARKKKDDDDSGLIAETGNSNTPIVEPTDQPK